ncbi:MAG: hypothetical protein CMF39_00865 [Legionellaceae bacterium]|nr:hypothetical protein [Legionellaceae bacterium]|tara:strand:- start:1385 stop:2140 length:756 start_codon:yes stop_codon:yes gene_type:complete
MSIIYDLPLVHQQAEWLCWRVAAAIVMSGNPDPSCYTEVAARHTFLLKSDSIFEPGFFAELERVAQHKGLPLNQLKRAYNGFGLSSIRDDIVGNILTAETEEAFQSIFEEILGTYGPLVACRPALGLEGMHAEAIVGVFRGNPFPDQPGDEESVWLVVNDSMLGREDYRHWQDVQALLKTPVIDEDDEPVPEFWYNSDLSKVTDIPQKDLSGYYCTDMPPLHAELVPDRVDEDENQRGARHSRYCHACGVL